MTPSTDANVTERIRVIATRARAASRVIANASSAQKEATLHAMADALVEATPAILDANSRDLDRGVQQGLSAGLLDRLELTPDRVEGIADALRHVASLPDPIGEIVRGSTLANGLRLRQMRVPMGVVGMIYEARPNVTVDAAGIAIKSGNAAILRGGSAALETNEVTVDVLRRALQQQGMPQDLVQSIDAFGREGSVALMQARGLVDVLVPRGGAGLIQTVVQESKVPVLETGVGNCHIYVDKDVDEQQALDIVVNSKTQRDSVCNATETLLVNQLVAGTFLPKILQELSDRDVVIHGCELTVGHAPVGVSVLEATEEDWATEYLGPEIAVRVVADIDDAIDHIATWSSGHTDAICTTVLSAAEEFVSRVDSAVVNVNASTRFTDGGEFGLGAEIGISTQKLHARGPMGPAELTTTKWIVYGDGQTR